MFILCCPSHCMESNRNKYDNHPKKKGEINNSFLGQKSIEVRYKEQLL